MFKFTRLAALLVLAAAFTHLLPATAHAQKPALVRNVDEPGRAPYQHSVHFSQTFSTCQSFICLVSFPPVPAGYRLVVTHASASYALVAGGSDAAVYLGADGDIVSNTLLLPVAVNSGSNFYYTSSPVTYFVEPGSTPYIILSGSFIATNGLAANVAIIGYLVAIP
jgi:hypothetical protein